MRVSWNPSWSLTGKDARLKGIPMGWTMCLSRLRCPKIIDNVLKAKQLHHKKYIWLEFIRLNHHFIIFHIISLGEEPGEELSFGEHRLGCFYPPSPQTMALMALTTEGTRKDPPPAPGTHRHNLGRSFAAASKTNFKGIWTINLVKIPVCRWISKVYYVWTINVF